MAGVSARTKKRTIRCMTQLETAPYYRRENGKNRKKATRRAWSRRSLDFYGIS